MKACAGEGMGQLYHCIYRIIYVEVCMMGVKKVLNMNL